VLRAVSATDLSHSPSSSEGAREKGVPPLKLSFHCPLSSRLLSKRESGLGASFFWRIPSPGQGFLHRGKHIFHFHRRHQSLQLLVRAANRAAVVAVEIQVATTDGFVGNETIRIPPRDVGRVERGCFDNDLVGHLHRGGQMHVNRIHAHKAVEVLHQRRGLAKVRGRRREDWKVFGCHEDLRVFLLFIGTAEKHEGGTNRRFRELLHKFEPMRKGPALESKVLCATAAEVKTEALSRTQTVVGN
jgi:hypothetical protein